MATTIDGTQWETVPWLQSDTTSTTSATATTTDGILGKDAFLKLLVTELRYQDPLEPMKDKEFISQMATFSSLEQMQNLNTTVTGVADTLNNQWLPSMIMQQAGQLIGRQVAYLGTSEDGETTETLTGTVTSVTMNSGTPTLFINGEAVSMDQVFEIGGSDVSSETGFYSSILSKLSEISEKLGVEEEEGDG